MKTNSLITFLAGSAVGAAFGLLFAPEKGEVTRRKIKDAVKDGCDRLEEALADAMGDSGEDDLNESEADYDGTGDKETVVDGKSETDGTVQDKDGNAADDVAGRKIEIA